MYWWRVLSDVMIYFRSGSLTGSSPARCGVLGMVAFKQSVGRWCRKNSADTELVEHRNLYRQPGPYQNYRMMHQVWRDVSSTDSPKSLPYCGCSSSLSRICRFLVTLKTLLVPINRHKARIWCVRIYWASSNCDSWIKMRTGGWVQAACDTSIFLKMFLSFFSCRLWW